VTEKVLRSSAPALVQTLTADNWRIVTVYPEGLTSDVSVVAICGRYQQ